MHQLLKYDLTTSQGTEAFKDQAFRIVGVTDSPLTNSLWARAWTIARDGGSEEVLYCFWDLCDIEGF